MVCHGEGAGPHRGAATVTRPSQLGNRPAPPASARAIAALLLLSGAILGCSAPERSTAGPSTQHTSVSSSPPSPEATTTTVPSLPEVGAYTPVAGEPGSDAKAAAAEFIERVGTYSNGEGPDLLTRETAELSNPGASRDALAPLASSDADAVSEVVYPQLGGLLTNSASVMTVVRQHLRRDGEVVTSTRTYDIRVEFDGVTWRVVDVVPPTTLPGNAPSPAATELIAQLGPELPDTALQDLNSGGVDPRLLELLGQVTEAMQFSVTVFAGGHPAEVYGTTSQSNHTAGRGVDIWQVGGQSVFDQRNAPSSPARQLAELALAAGATEVGAPWDLDGPGGASFANDLHQDHLHLAFDG